MESAEINRRFLAFFGDRGHTVVPSASLVAADPTLLFVNAGMAPFKPYFLGTVDPPYRTAASIQKVVRTPDIDIVGTNTRTLTFFQMAGNFSFGDYFKERAIPLAWELLTSSQDDGGFGFSPDRLWPTVYESDDEALLLWTRTIGVPPERVQRRGKEDNFWHMGVPGPCGPCSEIYYDRGPEHGREGGPVVDENRYLEVWNLVFMQDERGAGEGYDFPVIGPLPARNIDTGMGVERMAAVLQGVDTVYETDLLRPLLDLAGELTGTRYGADPATDVRLRVVADHARTATMLMGDGVAPSNEGGGYVLRRILRRVIRTGRLLGADGPIAAALVGKARDVLAPSYPELAERFATLEATAVAEEESFTATLRTGTALFERGAADTRAGGRHVVSGRTAFELHDTYGFPIDLTLEMARESGLTVDEEGFRRLMQEQRARARADAQSRKVGRDPAAYRPLVEAAGASTFSGYETVSGEATVRGLLVDGVLTGEAGPGALVEVALDRTPFYAEAGGQLADEGLLRLDSGGLIEVTDVQRPLPHLIVHRGTVRGGTVRPGAGVLAEIDIERRRAISRAHTATHLLHRAVRGAMGEQAVQAGSQNAPGRLRFDFSSPAGVPASVLADVEEEINRVLADDLPVRAYLTTQEDARASGALALFGEKYGDEVRVVEVGSYARELCGGTHAARSGQLGLVKLLGESSIGAGVRRVEGLVGLDAFRFLAREHVLLTQLASTVGARAEELPERVGAALERLRAADKELERLRSGALLESAGTIAAAAGDVYGVAVVTHRVPDGTGPDDVRRLALEVRGRLDAARPGVAAVAAARDGRAVLVVAVNDVGRQWGLAAGALVGAGAPALGGGGGGRDDVAQGGGARVAGLDEALRAVADAVGRRVTGGS